MHPLQVLGILNGRYRKLARLDTDAVVTGRRRAPRPGAGRASTYPAKKALEATRALGPEGFARAFAELHRADVGIKGATGLPEGAVLEIAVARLANLHRGGGRGRGVRQQGPLRGLRRRSRPEPESGRSGRSQASGRLGVGRRGWRPS